MKNYPLSYYCDKDGYPGTIQSDGSYDGGDTAAIIGTVRALAPMAASLIMPGYPTTNKGIPIRHPDTTKWCSQPDRFSRDQLLALQCGILGSKLFGLVEFYIFKLHMEKYFLTAWNTKGNGEMDMPNKFPDVCGPEVWALWIRIVKPWWANTVLWLLDVQTLVGAIQWRWFTPATNRVARNHMLVCLATQENNPSVTSKLACWINNWTDLVSRWEAHCDAVGEYPTADLFRQRLGL